VDITVIANHPIVTAIVLNASVFGDEENDMLYLSNPLDKPMPVTFWNPDKVSLTFEGEAFESLQLPPESLAKLEVIGGDISVVAEEGGQVVPIPLVPPSELNPTNWWNFKTDSKLLKKGFTPKMMRALYATELEKLRDLD